MSAAAFCGVRPVFSRPVAWGKVPLLLTYLRDDEFINCRDRDIWDVINKALQIKANEVDPLTIGRIAKYSRCTERHAYRSVAKLKERGYLTVQPVPGKPSIYHTVEYITAKKPPSSETISGCGNLPPYRNSFCGKENATPDRDVRGRERVLNLKEQARQQHLEKQSKRQVFRTSEENFPQGGECNRTAEGQSAPEQPVRKTITASSAREALRARGVVEFGMTSCYLLVHDFSVPWVMGAVTWFDAENRKRRRKGDELIEAGMLVEAIRAGFGSNHRQNFAPVDDYDPPPPVSRPRGRDPYRRSGFASAADIGSSGVFDHLYDNDVTDR